MPTREREIADLLKADAQMVALLPGGIYTDEELGVEGIRRASGSPTTAAFDAAGFLKTCALVRQDAVNPIGSVRNPADKFVATSQIVYVFFYERRGHSDIDAARQRSFEVLEGVRLSDSYQITWEYDSPAYFDMGPVANSTALRQEWRVVGIRRAA